MRNAWNYGYYFNGKKDDGVNDLSTLLNEGKIRCDWETGVSLESLSPEQKQGTKEATQMLLAADHKEDQDTTEPTQTALMCWLFAKQMQLGDIIFAREAKTQDYIYGIITGNYHYDENRPQFKHSRSINWLSQKPITVAEVKYLITKALTYIKWPKTVETLTTALNIDMNKLPEIKPDISAGSSKKDPRNVIFYGPPGTGKTYKTKEHAIKVCMGEGSYLRGRETIDFQDLLKNGQVEFTTFHQSYDYADFVVGFKPETKGDTMVFKPKPGLLLRLAKRARENPAQQYLLIMDEINRGNISKIFGELITLIEADKRADGDFPLNVTLPCSCPDYLDGENNDQFSLPSNVHFLGTMNTADRSIALLDTALRRRFHFEEMKPNPDKLSENYDGINLRVLLTKLNNALRGKLTRDHQIGHAWFPIGEKNKIVHDANDIIKIFDQKIIPIIDEWFYDDSDTRDEILKEITKPDSKDKERSVTDIDKLKEYAKE